MKQFIIAVAVLFAASTAALAFQNQGGNSQGGNIKAETVKGETIMPRPALSLAPEFQGW